MLRNATQIWILDAGLVHLQYSVYGHTKSFIIFYLRSFPKAEILNVFDFWPLHANYSFIFIFQCFAMEQLEQIDVGKVNRLSIIILLELLRLCELVHFINNLSLACVRFLTVPTLYKITYSNYEFSFNFNAVVIIPLNSSMPFKFLTLI